jgi:cold shock protein
VPLSGDGNAQQCRGYEEGLEAPEVLINRLDPGIAQGHLISTDTNDLLSDQIRPEHLSDRGAGVSAPSRRLTGITFQESKLRYQYSHSSRRRELNADTDYGQPRAFGTRPRFSQPRFEAPSGPPITGMVKWFSPEKGFGFIELSDGSGDAFLHGSVLAQSGIGAVQPGETLEVRIGPGHKGPHVTEVVSVDSSSAVPVAPEGSGLQSAISHGSSSAAVEVTGTVKWFNVQKGFGFITRNDNGQDTFIHVSALEQSGMTALSEGQAVVIDVVQGRKGLEAARVRLI